MCHRLILLNYNIILFTEQYQEEENKSRHKGEIGDRRRRAGTGAKKI